MVLESFYLLQSITAGRKISEYKSPLSYQTRCISLFHDNKGFAMGCIEGRIALEYFDELHTKNQACKHLSVFVSTIFTLNAFSVGNGEACNEELCLQMPQVWLMHSLIILLNLFSRDGNDIFSVNAIHFHPKNTYCSVGSDGVLSFWDKEARHRLSHLEQFKRQCPITDVKFNAAVRWIIVLILFLIMFILQGNWMFYSMSYDWSRGAENNDPKVGWNIEVIFSPNLSALSFRWAIISCCIKCKRLKSHPRIRKHSARNNSYPDSLPRSN